MLKQIVSTLCFFYLSTSAFAGAGDLFVVSSNGTGNSISITLCLNINGNKPISCQNYTVNAGALTIRTTIPNKSYQYAGIRINTPGYSYSSPANANAYSFVGMVSSTQAATGVVRPISSTLATTTPANVSADTGQTATFSTIASGGIMPYTYQWQLSPNGGIDFSNISFATEASYTTGTLNTTYNGYQYRVVVLDATSDSVTSGAATLTVNAVLSVTVTPGSLSVDSGQTALFTANPIGGMSPYSYQWYSCTNSACTSSTAILGATSSTYNPSTATTGTYYYQAFVTDFASSPETAATNVATLTVNSLPHIIFVTTDTYTGNLEGLSGADQKCNSDPGKPGGFALDYNYKALLNGNNATASGTAYYRTDGITLIATATGGNLVGLSPLTHSIEASGSLTVWTGANGNSCSNWTSNTVITTGGRGAASSSLAQYWFAGTSTCSTTRALYCVSQ